MLVDYVRSERVASIPRGCRFMKLSRTSYAYEPDTEKGRPVVEALQELAENDPRQEFRLMFGSLRCDGHKCNQKRIHRVCIHS